ncbi:MAG: hypothetical protein QNJ51_12015 [Calothrix sp. MO_167.B12]|nr:hypothetical protein [Calothrix sp. MO_167.B12]
MTDIWNDGDIALRASQKSKVTHFTAHRFAALNNVLTYMRTAIVGFLASNLFQHGKSLHGQAQQ